MDKVIDPHKFAELVVSKKSFTGTNEKVVHDVMELYKLAYDKCEERNKPIIKKKNKSSSTSESVERLKKQGL